MRNQGRFHSSCSQMNAAGTDCSARKDTRDFPLFSRGYQRRTTLRLYICGSGMAFLKRRCRGDSLNTEGTLRLRECKYSSASVGRLYTSDPSGMGENMAEPMARRLAVRFP